MQAYLRPIGDTIHYSDTGNFDQLPANPDGFEWVFGDFSPLIPLNLKLPLEKMKEIVSKVSPEIRAEFAQAIAEVEVLLREGDPDAAKIVLQDVTVPDDLKPLIQQLLSAFP